jgi:hypothetical protein
MFRIVSRASASLALCCALVASATGCRTSQKTNCPTPATSGLNTRDLLDPSAEADAQELSSSGGQFGTITAKVQTRIQEVLQESAPKNRAPRNVLCLSGGGSYGAYTAGVLVGWTRSGTRPEFDVVTGISTGALIAPFAFLGPKYDAQLQTFYTRSTNDDIFKKRLVRGLLGGEAFTDTAPLRRQIADFLCPEALADIATAHRAGRRLVVGTTEEEGKRFVLWDIGAIACRNGPGDRDLIIDALIGSASLPGLFPASKIDVFVDGKCHTERHVDGGVSQALFFFPPYVPPEQRNPQTLNLVGTNVYVIVAGKVYADPEVLKPTALTQAGKAVSAIIYAQTRGDLQRLWTYSLLNGMNYHVTAIPGEYANPGDAGEFDPRVMCQLFEEGRRVINSDRPWRTTPPGTNAAAGELPQTRSGRCLTFQPRGPQLPIKGPKGTLVQPQFPGTVPDGPVPVSGQLPASGRQ